MYKTSNLFNVHNIEITLNLNICILQEWELIVISKLQWRIVAVTSFDYVDPIMEQIKWKRRNDSMLRRHMLTLISFCYIGKYYIMRLYIAYLYHYL